MANKRKKKKMKKNQVQTPFPVFLANILVLVTVLGLSYMWLCSRCDALGKEIKEKERELIAVEKRATDEQDRWSNITSPVNLARAIKKYHLGMAMPRESQIIRVSYQENFDDLVINR
jgi:cell division protein FtsB